MGRFQSPADKVCKGAVKGVATGSGEVGETDGRPRGAQRVGVTPGLEDVVVLVLFRIALCPGRPTHYAGDVVIVVGPWAGGREEEVGQQCLDVSQNLRGESGSDVAAWAVFDEAVWAGRGEPDEEELDSGSSGELGVKDAVGPRVDPDVDEGGAWAGVHAEDEACTRSTRDEIGAGSDSDLIDPHEGVEVGE